MGLGDVVEKVTEATGIKKAVKAIVGDDCGCEERKKALNARFRFYKEMTDEQKVAFEAIDKEAATDKLTAETQRTLNAMYSDIFRAQVKFTNCGMCLIQRIDRLRKVYELCQA